MIVTCAEYDPAARPVAVVLTETVSVSVVIVPEEGVIVIHGALAVAIHVLSLSPARLFESMTDCGNGSVLPLVAIKVRELGLTCKAHNGLTKAKNNVNINAVPPRIFGIGCRIGAVHSSWSIIRVVRSGMKPPLLSPALSERSSSLLAKVCSNACARAIFIGSASKRLAGTG